MKIKIRLRKHVAKEIANRRKISYEIQYTTPNTREKIITIDKMTTGKGSIFLYFFLNKRRRLINYTLLSLQFFLSVVKPGKIRGYHTNFTKLSSHIIPCNKKTLLFFKNRVLIACSFFPPALWYGMERVWLFQNQSWIPLPRDTFAKFSKEPPSCLYRIVYPRHFSALALCNSDR